jgi:sugar-specific transcriptional regulator TrmB
MQLQKQLKSIGLNNSEIEIYLYLLSNGISTPPQIAKGTRIARTNCYNILQELKNKDLITEQLYRKRKSYLANNPTSLIKDLDKKREIINNLLPDLAALFKTQKNKPIIKFYDGLEGIKEVFMQNLEADEILGIASTKQLFALDTKFFDYHRDEMKKKNIIFRDIITYASSEESMHISKGTMGALITHKILPKKYNDLPVDILVWQDKVALMITSDPIFGTVIQNEFMAKTFRMMFDVMWDSL